MKGVQWRTSQYYGGDIAWFYGVLYRVKPINRHKFEVAYDGQFYRKWKTFGSALSRIEAEVMCMTRAEAEHDMEDSES